MNIKDKELRDRALVFYEEDMQAIEAILDAFLKKSAARCGILVDKDGHMITARGDTKAVDLDTISALVAGSFAATKALAHQFGEADFTALFHQGRGGNIQMSLVGDRALLTALFSDNTTIGMVRLYASEAAKRLTDLFRRKLAAPEPRAEDGAPASEEAEAFKQGSAGVLDQLFGE
jgi:predicted regulator of Ras-like GTPase activity (Roadblock/LC7/MglB family)